MSDRPSRFRDLPGVARLVMFAVYTAGVVAVVWAWRNTGTPDDWKLVAVFAVLTVITELRPLPLRGEEVHLTVSTVFGFAVLLTGGPGPAVTVFVTAAVIADLVNRRVWWKLVFNAGMYASATVTAGLVLREVTGTFTPGFGGWVGLVGVLTAGAVFELVNGALLTCVIWLAAAGRDRETLRRASWEWIGSPYQIPQFALYSLVPVVVTAGRQNLLLVVPVAGLVAGTYWAAHIAMAREREAATDALTGLPNRTAFTTETKRLTGTGELTGVAVIDLVGFSELNDTLGHDIGDLVLRVYANLLGTGDGWVAARIGGDEFGLLITGPDPYQVVNTTVDLLKDAAGTVAERTGFMVDLSAHVGLTVTDREVTAPVLIARADLALAHAKSRWDTPVSVWEPGMEQATQHRVVVAGKIRPAITAGEFRVVYQPKIDLRTREPIGLEALVRWAQPDGTFINPDDFIPVAESTGAVTELTRFVIRQAARDVAFLHHKGLNLPVAVNVSTRALATIDIPTEIRDVTVEYGLTPGTLNVEITESMVMADPGRAVRDLARLRVMGVKVSVDDYGTGHSSLAYLKDLPVDELKIDKSFVTGLLTDERCELMTRTTIDMGRGLGLTVVAEGVETSGLFERLVTLGCDQAQGFFVTRPLPVEQIPGWVESWAYRTAPTM